MNELNIKDPCRDCPLFVGSGENVLDIYDKRLLPMAKDGVERALGCKHPWRVAFKRFKGKPNTPQRQILSTLVELRGKNPVEYGLEPTENTPHAEVDLSMYETVINSIAADLVGYFTIETVGELGELIVSADEGKFDNETLQGLLSTFYTNHLDVPAEVFDCALRRAQDTVLAMSVQKDN